MSKLNVITVRMKEDEYVRLHKAVVLVNAHRLPGEERFSMNRICVDRIMDWVGLVESRMGDTKRGEKK